MKKLVLPSFLPGILIICLIIGLMANVISYMGVAMVIAQIMTLLFFPNMVYHDPYRVLSQADQMAANQNTWDITYFWRYPNNVSITYLMSLWLR